MESLDDGRHYTDYELPLERADDPDVLRVSTPAYILKKDLSSYQESYAKEHEDDTEDHFLGAVAGLSAVGIGLGIFAYVKHRNRTN